MRKKGVLVEVGGCTEKEACEIMKKKIGENLHPTTSRRFARRCCRHGQACPCNRQGVRYG